MTVYVAEISGRGIVAFDAATEDDAKACLSDRALRRDLRVFQNQGRSLWDGVSEIKLRAARPGEVEMWQASRAATVRPQGAPGETWRIFLLPVVDPSTFDDDDRDDGD